MSLINYIRQKIHKNDGAISFSEFMNSALYTEKAGFYQKMNFNQNFTTAPEISNLFSQTIASHIQSFLDENILEFGAGSGKMAVDILLYLNANNQPPKQYFIVEISEKLRRNQQNNFKKLAPELLEKVKWIDKIPDNFNGVILMNEVLDAIPVDRFIIKNQQTFSLNVGLDKTDNFVNSIGKKISIDLPLTHCPDGFISEYHPKTEQFLSNIIQRLSTGLILIIDYGYQAFEYYSPQRNQGTLTCFFKHQKHNNPFINIGDQDISVHLNFNALADIAKKNQAIIERFETQSQFLLKNGITELAEKRNLSNTKIRLQTSQEIQKLTLPAQMGEVIKVMAIQKDGA